MIESNFKNFREIYKRAFWEHLLVVHGDNKGTVCFRRPIKCSISCLFAEIPKTIACLSSCAGS